MEPDLAEYRDLIERFTADASLAAHGPRRGGDDAWTLQEMVAHLVDSASNNHQRFVRLQLADRLEFPAYDAEEWRRASRAKTASYRDLVALYLLYNRYILHLVAWLDRDCLGNRWLSPDGDRTLAFSRRGLLRAPALAPRALRAEDR
jgi:hypothetical protein